MFPVGIGTGFSCFLCAQSRGKTDAVIDVLLSKLQRIGMLLRVSDCIDHGFALSCILWTCMIVGCYLYFSFFDVTRAMKNHADNASRSVVRYTITIVFTMHW